jgi:hypothetical protein
MPLYKFVGNKILTTLQNRLANVSLTEWHSGYRAYSVAALRKVNFLKNSDYFDFDSQISFKLACCLRNGGMAYGRRPGSFLWHLSLYLTMISIPIA